MNPNRFPLRYVCLSLALFTCVSLSSAQTAPDATWSAYGKDLAASRFSPASQINRTNVSQLKLAWTYRTGALDVKTDLIHKAAFETTPILINGTLYLTTPYNHVIALNAATGAKLWEYDPQIDLTKDFSEVSSRGVSFWQDKKAKSGSPCASRIIYGTLDARLIALDASTGKLCTDFGKSGTVNLAENAMTTPQWTGGYQLTSAPTVLNDLVVVGSSIADNWLMDTGRGVVRAYEARTGKLRWTWDPIPWVDKSNPRSGAANAWSTISADEKNNLVFVPTGSASPDYWGGFRKGDNKWANSVVALEASTGKFVWGFQVVHHDLWDYDVASQPTLFTWKNDTPAIAITTKMGRVFVLNRLTGKPLLPVEEKPVPQSDIAGEESSPTQPSSISTVPEGLTPEQAWGRTPEDQKWCADKVAASRSEGIFTPVSLKGTIVFPGNVGGTNWGSSAYDDSRHLLIMNNNHLAMWAKLIPRETFNTERTGGEDNRLKGEFGTQKGTPFGMYREPFLNPHGVPCTPPPWGTVTAVDLFTGKVAWNVPLGSFVPGKNTGTINLGGPIATAGGLVFDGAAMDTYFRAFNSDTGEKLWEMEIPASAQSTPMTYSLNGIQYVVIAAGGHGKLNSKQGDYVLAFTLP